MRRTCVGLVLLFLLPACRADGPAVPVAAARRAEWAVAIHGGAGVTARSMEGVSEPDVLESLRRALDLARSALAAGESSLDAVEKVVVFLEDDPLFNAGRGAVYNHEGLHELDAAIMDGATLRCGAVAGVTTVKNPVLLARRVMERTTHILLGGAGADRFAREIGLEPVGQDYFHTERRRRQWLEKVKAPGGERPEAAHGTVGAVALDRHGNLAAATSTGGLTGKRFGRIGDTPLVGAGTYAGNATCAVSGTGIGEEFMRHVVAHRVATLMEDRGLTVEQAASRLVFDTLKPGDGGLIAVGRDGSLALVFNSEGMLRGAADSNGRFEVAIWK